MESGEREGGGSFRETLETRECAALREETLA